MNKEEEEKKQNSKNTTWEKADFIFKEYIGKGTFGYVYRAIEKDSQMEVAIKVIKKSRITDQKQYLNLKREIEIHSRLNHKHITKLFGYFQDEQKIYIIMEYAQKGNLYQYLHNPQNKLSENQIAKYILQIATAIDYLRKRYIIHRDLKLENIVLYNNNIVKITDFGNAVHTQSNQRKTFCGTAEYLSPEMVNKQIYDNQIDMWCLGVLTYELLYKKSPFQVYQDGKREFSDQNIKNVQFNFDDKINLISQNAKDFISQLLVKNPENRLTTQDIITHKFIINNMGYPTPNKSTMLIEN